MNYLSDMTLMIKGRFLRDINVIFGALVFQELVLIWGIVGPEMDIEKILDIS